MNKPIIFNKGMVNELKNIQLPFKAEIHNNVIDYQIGKSGGKRILNIVCECPPSRAANETIIRSSHEFDLILTHDEDVLAQCNNARKMLFGTSWIRPEDRINAWDNKEYGVSFICGSKNRTAGHKLRHKIWARQDEIKLPTKFWSSSRSPIVSKGLTLPIEPDGKRLAFGEMYHIAIENTRAKNYFTEKLIDCFITKTIPIYCGCPNIWEYFDTFGMIFANNERDIIHICNHLNQNVYSRILTSIDENYQLALQYARPFARRLQEKIIEVFGDK